MKEKDESELSRQSLNQALRDLILVLVKDHFSEIGTSPNCRGSHGSEREINLKEEDINEG